MSENDVPDYFKKLYGDRIMNTAKECSYFGGRIPVNPTTSTDKMIERNLRKEYAGKKLPNVSRKLISHFCDSIEGIE